MINHLLMLVILALSVFQPNRERFVVALLFSVSCIVHSVVSINFTDILYYMSALSVDVAVIGIVCAFATSCRFVDRFLALMFISGFANVYGAVIYTNGLDPISYNLAFSVIYFLMCLVFLGREKGHDRARNSGIYLLNNKRHRIPGSLCQKAET